MMTRSSRGQRGTTDLSPRIGDVHDAQRITVNLSAEIGDELRLVAARCRASESSVVEIALRYLLRRVGPAALPDFLRDNGACLRRRRSVS
jgi:hypothetical protein